MRWEAIALTRRLLAVWALAVVRLAPLQVLSDALAAEGVPASRKNQRVVVHVQTDGALERIRNRAGWLARLCNNLDSARWQHRGRL